jgi:ureidoglycolate amidohydrolase
MNTARTYVCMLLTTAKGIVTAIAGPASADVVFEGEGGHAGGKLMTERHDAVLAGAEFALSAESAALSSGSSDTVATSGVFLVEPGAENSIGRRVRVSLDVRDVDGGRRDGVLEACRRSAAAIGARRGVSAAFRVRSQDAPAQCAAVVMDATVSAATRLGYSYRRMVSRAYHDALLMARSFPTGMIFSALVIPLCGTWHRNKREREREREREKERKEGVAAMLSFPTSCRRNLSNSSIGKR